MTRRYVLIKINDKDVISRIKVVSGSDLAPLDTTGTLTQKYQASIKNLKAKFELVNKTDTELIKKLCGKEVGKQSPTDGPLLGTLLPIKSLYEKLKPIVGASFIDPGAVQERNRGAELHRLVCKALGFSDYKDSGQFPDIRNQLLEVKLQTSPTIDLGLILPDTDALLDMEKINDSSIRHCDIRYAIFYGELKDGYVTITNLILTNGENFFDRMSKFEGKGLNKKIQIPLPKNYFEH